MIAMAIIFCTIIHLYCIDLYIILNCGIAVIVVVILG